MDGDDLTCIANNGFNYAYDDNNSAHCTGHVAHELGHVLGLDHEGPNDDSMQYGFYTNDANDLCSFSAANVAQILATPANAGWFGGSRATLASVRSSPQQLSSSAQLRATNSRAFASDRRERDAHAFSSPLPGNVYEQDEEMLVFFKS